MKKMVKKLLLIAVALLTVVSFASCGDDDDDEYANYKYLIVGYWEIDNEDGYSIAQFNKDGTGLDYEYDDEDGGSEEEFTWEIEGNKLYITVHRETSVATINKLTTTTLTMTMFGETVTAYRVNGLKK